MFLFSLFFFTKLALQIFFRDYYQSVEEFGFKSRQRFVLICVITVGKRLSADNYGRQTFNDLLSNYKYTYKCLVN